MSPKQRFNLMIEPEVADVLKRLQQTTGAPASEHVRRAILLYLAQQFGITVEEVQRRFAKKRAVEAATARLKARWLRTVDSPTSAKKSSKKK